MKKMLDKIREDGIIAYSILYFSVANITAICLKKVKKEKRMKEEENEEKR